MATFDESLKKGQFGPIAVGMARDEVRGLLGDPQDISVAKDPEIWKYGPVEIAFYRALTHSVPVVASVTYYPGHDAAIPPGLLEMTGWMPSPETSREGFRSHFGELGISLRSGADPDSTATPLLLTREGVAVIFVGDRLAQIGFTSRGKAEHKQVSISVRTDELGLIHREARSRGISVSALCSLWVSEQAMNLKVRETTPIGQPVAHQQA